MPNPIFDMTHLPNLPRAALRVLNLCQDPQVEIPELRAAIEMDPALVARIVRVANSSLFGLSREISSVQQAVVILGLRTVKLTVLTTSLVYVFPGVRQDPRMTKIWRRILTNAIAGRLLARNSPFDPEELFLTCMMQDVGLLVLGHQLGNTYFNLLESSQADGGEPLEILERKELGTTHSEIAAKLVEAWALPERMIDSVTRHHQMNLETALISKDQDITTIMAIAEATTLFLNNPTLRNQKDFLLASAIISARGYTMDGFVEQLHARLEEISELFDIQVSDGEEEHRLYVQVQELLSTVGTAPNLIDPVTGVFHLDTLNMRLRQELALALRQKWPLAIVLFTVTDVVSLLREGKDTEANRMLRQVSTAVSKAVRASDSLFRVRADTFCLVAGDTPLAGVDVLIRRMQQIFGGDYAAVIVRGDSQPSEDQILQLVEDCLEESRLKGEPVRRELC